MEPRCTEWLKNGDLKILVGTGSLLGEGWDCPSINSLILASQIGSFVSSNQMRGRAIRKFKKSSEQGLKYLAFDYIKHK